MVYRGKPSKGCHACRKRKIRCDQKALPEGCSQCATKGQACPGYRNQLDLMFENESANVARKATSKSRASSGSPDPPPGKAAKFDWYDKAAYTDIVVRSSYTISPSAEEKGNAYFYTNYAVDPTSLAAISFGSDPPQITLSACISALGLAGLSTMLNDYNVLREARKQYVRAIRLTNQVLNLPELAKSDSALLSVLLLGGFETVTGSSRESLTAWSNHVHGAGTLLKLRGVDQLRTITGRQIFGHVAFSLLTTCLHQGIPLPEYVFTLRDEAYGFLPKAAHRKWRVLDAMLSFADFSGKINRGEITDPAEVIKKGLEVDERFQTLIREDLEDWKYHSVYTDSKDDLILLGYYDVYEGHWAAQMWNGVRSMRILLMQHLLDNIPKAWPISAERAAKEEGFAKSLKQCQYDIIASVPFQMGYNNTCSPYDFPKDWQVQPGGGNSSDVSGSLVPLIRMSGGYTMLWPLFLVGFSRFHNPDIRDWCIRVLRRVGSKLGIRQAYLVADLLETETDVTTVYRERDAQSEAEKLIAASFDVEDFMTLPNRSKQEVQEGLAD